MYPSLEFYSGKRALTYNVPVSFVSMTVNKQVEKKKLKEIYKKTKS